MGKRIKKPDELGWVEDDLEGVAEGAYKWQAYAKYLEEKLKWTFEYINDNNPGSIEEGDTPEHGCEYHTTPDKGHCDFHENFFEIADVLGYLEPEIDFVEHYKFERKL